MSEVTLHIEGMSCGHCLNAVRRALEGVEGAALRTVQIGRAEVEGDADPAALVAAVEAAGYRATAVPGTADA